MAISNISGLTKRYTQLETKKTNSSTEKLNAIKSNADLKNILKSAVAFLGDTGNHSEAEGVAHFLMGKGQLPIKFQQYLKSNGNDTHATNYNESKNNSIKSTIDDLLRTHRYFSKEDPAKTIAKIVALDKSIRTINNSSENEQIKLFTDKKPQKKESTEQIVKDIKTLENDKTYDLDKEEKFAKKFASLSKNKTKEELMTVIKNNNLSHAILEFNYKYIDPSKKGFYINQPVSKALQECQSEIRESSYKNKNTENLNSIEKHRTTIFTELGNIHVDNNPAILEKFNNHIQPSFASLADVPEESFNKSIRYFESGIFNDSIEQAKGKKAYGYSEISNEKHYINQKKHFLKLINFNVNGEVSINNPKILINGKLNDDIVKAINTQILAAILPEEVKINTTLKQVFSPEKIENARIQANADVYEGKNLSPTDIQMQAAIDFPRNITVHMEESIKETLSGVLNKNLQELTPGDLIHLFLPCGNLSQFIAVGLNTEFLTMGKKDNPLQLKVESGFVKFDLIAIDEKNKTATANYTYNIYKETNQNDVVATATYSQTYQFKVDEDNNLTKEITAININCSLINQPAAPTKLS